MGFLVFRYVRPIWLIEVMDLAGIPVGKQLDAALDAADLAKMSERELLEYVAASARQEAHLAARRIEATSRFVGAMESRPHEPGILNGRDATREMSLRLNISKGAAQYDVYEAQRLTGAMSPLLDSLDEGIISMRHARAVQPLLSSPELDEGLVNDISERAAAFASDHTPAETRARVAHWLISEDVESAEKRHADALAACDVTHEIRDNGTGILHIEGPLHVTSSIHRAIKAAAAKDAVGADPDGPSIGRRRSDLALGVLLDAYTPTDAAPAVSETYTSDEGLRLAEYAAAPIFLPQMSPAEVTRTYDDERIADYERRGLFEAATRKRSRDCELARLDAQAGYFPPSEDPPELTEHQLELLYKADPYQPLFIPPPRGKPARGRLLRHGVRPIQTSLHIDYTTARGIAQNPAMLDGCFPITPSYARVLIPQSDLSVLFTDPKSRTFLDRNPLRYVPSDEQAEFIRARDPICIAPGCLKPAIDCQLDHRVSYNHDDPTTGGLTVVDEMAPLCIDDHQLKTHYGFDLQKDENGVWWWVTPLRYRHRIDPYRFSQD